MNTTLISSAIGCALWLAACSSESGATCPPGSTLTYTSFAKGFVDTYCVRCHSSQLAGEEARQKAPEGVDYDTHDGVRANADKIDERAAAGPDSINDSMPPDGALPTEEDRRRLGEWIACGAP